MNTPAAPRAAMAASSDWFKSSFSGGQNGCVEVNLSVPGYSGIRDSKLGPASPVLAVSTVEWRALLASLRQA